MITVFGENSCDNFVTFYFTPYGDFFGDLPELVTIKVIVWSPRLVTMHVTILSLFVSPNVVIFKVIHRIFLTKCHLNWWKSSGFTNLGDNPIENVLGLLYGRVCKLETCSKWVQNFSGIGDKQNQYFGPIWEFGTLAVRLDQTSIPLLWK